MQWNNPNLWIILAVVGLSFLQWVVQRIREQAAINKAREAARRKQEEALRTGRPPEEEQRVAREAQQTRTALDEKQRLAIERRQEQLRELRRRQMQAQSKSRTRPTAGPAGAGGTATATRAPSLPPTSRVPTPPTRAPQQRPQPAPTSARQPQQPPARPSPRPSTTQRQPSHYGDLEKIAKQRQEEALRRQEMMRGKPSLTPTDFEDTLRPALAELRGIRGARVSTPDAHDATTSGSDLLSNLDADDWRRGIILAEILREPVSVRDNFARHTF